MNFFKHIIFFLLIITIFCSCINKSETGMVTFNTSPSHVSWKDKFVFDECIALNSTDSILLSTVSKCFVDDNQIIIHDNKSRKIFAFTREGKFKCQIGREGRAKSEYINIKDIALSHDHSTLYLLDDLGVIAYDALTGTFKMREKIKLDNFTSYWKFYVLDAGHYLLFNPQQDGLGEIIEYIDGEWKDVKKTGFYQLACERFYVYENNIRIIPSFGEFTICTYNNGQLTPSFNIDLGNNMLPSDIKPKSFDEFIKTSGEENWFKCILSAHETSSWIYANILGPEQKCYWLFGNKENGAVLCSPIPVDDGMQIVDSDNNSFYAIIHSELLGENSHVRDIIHNNKESLNTLYLTSFHIKK